MNSAPKWDKSFPLKFHESVTSQSWALFSSCTLYRYRLRREWEDGKSLLYIMLNPSTADEIKNDPTVERCERRARKLGYGAFEVVNIFAFRATNPRELYQTRDAIGEHNDQAIKDAIKSNDDILLAWGTHGSLNNRGAEIANCIRNLIRDKSVFCLGYTQSGEPRHPLYISYDYALELSRL